MDSSIDYAKMNTKEQEFNHYKKQQKRLLRSIGQGSHQNPTQSLVRSQKKTEESRRI